MIVHAHEEHWGSWLEHKLELWSKNLFTKIQTSWNHALSRITKPLWPVPTLSLASRSCLTTTVSASRRTWVTAARRHRAARTIEPLSAPIVPGSWWSSYCSSHNFSISAPVVQKRTVSIKNQNDFIRQTLKNSNLSLLLIHVWCLTVLSKHVSFFSFFF